MSAHRRRVSVAGEQTMVDRDLHAREDVASDSAEAASPLVALVTDTINVLTQKGISTEDMGPLLQLKTALESAGAELGSAQASTRDGDPASEELLARAAVIMDLLVQSGSTLERAAQSMARQLIACGVRLPDTGGDSRGWRRLLQWRVRLQHKVVSAAALEEYERFKQEIAAIPANQRLSRALEERLWDRREPEDG